MVNSEAEKNNKKKMREAQEMFRLAVFVYILIFTVAVQICKFRLKGESWCYFGLVIGLIYVYFAFYYFYHNHLAPYLKDLEEKKINAEKKILFWMSEWILPAMALQFFIYAGFWMTVSRVPFKDYMYCHPYLYGQAYKKIENYLSAEIPAAGLAVKPSEVLTEDMKAKLLQKGEVIEKEFSGYVKGWSAPDNRTGQEYLNAIIGLASNIYKIPFYIALTFSFLGTLMYTLNNASHRFAILDLYPKTFVGYLIRFLFAPALSLVIAYSLMDDWWITGAPALFFFVGFFPQLALQIIEDKVRTFLKLAKGTKTEFSVDLIQGVSDYIGYRMKELGIGDAQNLAYCDLNYLRNNWYNDRLICDFVAQALMLIHMGEDFSHLQKAGIRNIISFKKILGDDQKRKQIGDKLGIREKLDAVMDVIIEPPLVERIDTLEKIIKAFDTKEIEGLKAAGVAGD